jgi:hypothetical protein
VIIRFPTERTPQQLIPFVLGFAATLALLVGVVFFGVGWFTDEGDLRNTLMTLGGVSGGAAVLTFLGLWLRFAKSGQLRRFAFLVWVSSCEWRMQAGVSLRKPLLQALKSKREGSFGLES